MDGARYADGRLVRRRWTVQFDSKGRILGFDANRSARLRACPIGDAIRLIYDRPLGSGAAIPSPIPPNPSTGNRCVPAAKMIEKYIQFISLKEARSQNGEYPDATGGGRW